MEKTVKFIENPTKDSKNSNRTPKEYDSNNSKKNITSKTNTVRYKCVIPTKVWT